MSNDLILGIDLSLNSSGLTLIDLNGKPVHCEAIYPGYLRGQDRLRYIYERYLTIFSTFSDIRYIGFEKQVSQQRYNYNAKNILDIAEGFGVMKLALSKLSEHREIGVYQFTAQELKLFATDNGKATKEEMIAAVNARVLKKISSYTIEYSLDDIVDAYWAAMKTLDSLKAENDDAYLEKHLFFSNLKEKSIV